MKNEPGATPPAGNDPQRMHLCQCNNCNIILIDRNPQIDAPEYALKGNEKEMVFIEENCFWACPICKTDGYLQDNITIADYSIPAGNDLPEQLTYDPFDNHDSFYFESTRLGNDYDFRIEWSEHFARKREALRDEIVRRYNEYTELKERYFTADQIRIIQEQAYDAGFIAGQGMN